MSLTITSGIEAYDHLTKVLVELHPESPQRPVVSAVQAWAVNTEGKQAFVRRLDENSAALLEISTAMARLQAIETERGRLLAPVIEAAGRRMEWVAWLQSPGRGREVAYVVVTAAALLTRPDLLPAILGILTGGPHP